MLKTSMKTIYEPEKLGEKTMKTQKNKTLVSIALILILTMATSVMFMPTANAHTPPWEIKTFAYVTLAPDTVGVGQQMLAYMWLQVVPPTAEGAYGDRWQGYTITVTKPDGATETLGPFTSDPIGFSSTSYTPTQVGTYKFQFNFAGQTLAGNNRRPGSIQGADFVGDYFTPSTSDVATLTVQQDPVPAYSDTPVTSGPWTRPINGQLRAWDSISGNWYTAPLNWYARYTQGPKSSHILWTKPLTFGGLVGGEFGDTSYYSGNAYEGKITGTIIMNGYLYYNKYPDDTYAAQEPNNTYPRTQPKPGFFCVDLRTGEQLWYNNESRLSFGQVYRYDSPNQHGGNAYLWAVVGTTWKAYDPFTGDWVYSIKNVPAGTRAYTSDGSIVIPVVNVAKGWIALWNSSAIPELLGGPTGTQNWQWRPYGKTADGNKGYSWNKTLPAGITGAINYVFADDRIIGSSGLGRTGMWLNLGTANFTMWAISLKAGQEGQLMWKQSYTSNEGATYTLTAGSVLDGILAIWASETRQWHGYDINNGNALWVTEPQGAWDMTVSTVANIAYGKLFSCGYAGILYAYDVTTGKTAWTYAAKDPTYLESKWGGNYILEHQIIADGKIYVFSGEHSPDNPPERGAPLLCLDVNTGELLWEIPFYLSHWARNPAIADGIIVYLNIYDNQIYAIGKGLSATTVSAPQTVASAGTGVVITGTVTDQSPQAKGTPAIGDGYMDKWMEYLYMQETIPGNAQGVPVKLTAMDSSGNVINIGTVTSDMSGMFKTIWTPTAAGEYTIIASFEGSNAYWPSFAETAVGVSAGSSQPVAGEQTSTFSTVDIVIIVAVVIAIIIGLVNLLALRSRKQ